MRLAYSRTPSVLLKLRWNSCKLVSMYCPIARKTGFFAGVLWTLVARSLCPRPLPLGPAKGHATLALYGNCVNARLRFR